MEFFTAWKRPSLDMCPLEEHLDEGIVERAGYRTTEQMVNELLIAGQNLAVFRESEFGPDDEVPDDAPASRMLSNLDTELALRNVRKNIKDSIGKKVVEEKLKEEGGGNVVEGKKD